MADSLPSYGQATTRDPWSIVASHVRSADLCSAALVCRAWNNIFMPLLWGNPASHFGIENDAVYVALIRFKRTLTWARLVTRELTHSLHFPPAQAEIYDGPKPDWLSGILARLPKLQSLVVSQLPFFDHGALSSLVKGSLPDAVKNTPAIVYHLRLLDASNCTNMTPQVLSAALKLFPALLYLDLSGSSSARYPEVLSGLKQNQALQVLKMQRLGLNDESISILAIAVGRKLRSLDVSDNNITDRGVQALIENCVRRDHHSPSGDMSPSRAPGIRLQAILDGPQQDDYIRKELTLGYTSYLGIESSLGQGLTHLYISANRVTLEGGHKLLQSRQLRVLDLGDLSSHAVSSSSVISGQVQRDTSSTSAERLISTIEGSADVLAYLRINHTVITRLGSCYDQQIFELSAAPAIHLPAKPVELDSRQRAVYEMPDDGLAELPSDLTPYHELEGSPTVLPLQDPNIVAKDYVPTTEQESAPSPSLDACGGLFSPVSPFPGLGTSPRLGITTPTNHHLSVPTTSPSSRNEPTDSQGLEIADVNTSPSASRISHTRTYSGVLSDHDARLRYQQSQPHSLMPGTLPRLRTLVLTGVPAKASSPYVAQKIIDFVTACAEEERWAGLQASLSYQVPPGRDRQNAEKHLARDLFPLRKLVLEIAPEKSVAERYSGWLGPISPTQNTLSSTLDADCEVYLNAAKDDFSFFDAEEECGQPGEEGSYVPLAALKEKMVVVVEDGTQSSTPITTSQSNRRAAPRPDFLQKVEIDVLSEIGTFRRGKQAEYEAKLAAQGNGRGGDACVEGHWTGTIEIIRPR